MRLIFAVSSVLVIVSASFATGAVPANIALHKPYVFSFPPNYPLCTDSGDKMDLTDGIHPPVPKGSSLWGVKGCVGWMHYKVPISITIDLGRDQPISGVSFSSAAGGAGVAYPASIAISVGNDDKTFYTVGDLIELDQSAPPAPYGTYSTHIYRTTRLRTHGRYVRIAAVPSTVFLFCDEIEVYEGDESLLQRPLEGKVLSDAQLADPLRLTRLGVRRRLSSDWAQVHNAIKSDAPASVKGELLKELDALKPVIDRESYPRLLDGFKAILPESALDARIFSVRGKLLAAEGVPPLSLWHTRPYQLLDVLVKPQESLKELTVRMVGNEHRAEVFNLTNASGESKQARFTLEGLPDGVVRVSQVEYVDTREGRPVASALVPLRAKDGQYATTIPAGMTRQIWLSVDSKDISAGKYSGLIKVSSDSFNEAIKLQLDVASVRMVDVPALNADMFDYAYNDAYGVTSDNQQAAARDMVGHLINTVWGSVAIVPFPKHSDFDAQGNLTGRIDYSKWDGFVKFWPGMKQYMAFAAMQPTSTFAGLKPGAPRCDRAISQWATDWARHNQKLGLKPGQALILFIDEPPKAWMQACYNLIKPFADGTKEIGVLIDPGIHSVEDFEAARPTLELCEVVMPTLYDYYVDGPKVWALYRQLQEQGVRLGLYSCTGPTRQFDPSYFRMQPWLCFAAGATDSAFWAYGDNGGLHDSWNPYTAVGATNYTPVYLSPTGVTSTKHWEAMREGIEDYQCLQMLAAKEGSAAARSEASGIMDRMIREHSINYASTWTDCSQYGEEARLEMLKKLP